MFMGKTVCKRERKGEDNVVVKVMNYNVMDEDFNKLETNWRGDINYSGMIKNYANLIQERIYIKYNTRRNKKRYSRPTNNGIRS